MQSRSHARHLLALFAALAFAALLTTPGITPAAAQGLGWFGNLFGGGGAPRPRSGAPAYPGYASPGAGGDYDYAPEPSRPRRHTTRRKPVDQAPAKDAAKDAPKDKPAKNASLFVYVFGDSLGQMLANGLDDALADRQDVAVIHKAKGSTGLVTVDYYDWPKAIEDMVAGTDPDKDRNGKAEKKAGDGKAEKDAAKSDKAADGKTKDEPAKDKIDVAVMMIGTNDLQPIRIDGKNAQPGSPEWREVYVKRITALSDALRKKGIPLIWVGIPITKDDNFADDMAQLNEIYRDTAAKTGAIYVDTWEAFSDDNGNFSAFGPDINGQNVRLRAADGIHFTKAGARKLAHFVETHVRRALDGKTPPPELPADAPTDKRPVAAAKPDAGPIRNLNEPPSAKDGTLAKSVLQPGDKDQAAAIEASMTRGQAQTAPAGRADNAHWPQDGTPNP